MPNRTTHRQHRDSGQGATGSTQRRTPAAKHCLETPGSIRGHSSITQWTAKTMRHCIVRNAVAYALRSLNECASARGTGGRADSGVGPNRRRYGAIPGREHARAAKHHCRHGAPHLETAPAVEARAAVNLPDHRITANVSSIVFIRCCIVETTLDSDPSMRMAATMMSSIPHHLLGLCTQPARADVCREHWEAPYRSLTTDRSWPSA
jgi:hypothetical protein